MEYDDTLACIFARLLLWTDARALPAADAASQQTAWNYYNRNWRPGKPHPAAWPANWKAALVAISAPVAVTDTAAEASPVLRKGSTGEAVTALQQALIKAGYGSLGTFGDETDAAVRKFQADNGLTADGIVGKNTHAALDRLLT